MKDGSDTWSHGVRSYDQQVGEFGEARINVMESGLPRARVRARSSFHESTLITDWILYAGSRTPEAQVSLDWHEHLRMLKFAFPVGVTNARSTYEIAFGQIVRETNGDENPGQRRIDVSGRKGNGTYGFSVINDAKYGYSVTENEMRISIVRGAAYANHQPQKLRRKIKAAESARIMLLRVSQDRPEF